MKILTESEIKLLAVALKDRLNEVQGTYYHYQHSHEALDSVARATNTLIQLHKLAEEMDFDESATIPELTLKKKAK